MTNYKDAMPHGSFEEVFPDVFFVTGTMCNEFFGSDWCFGRNMTVVRENGNLTIFNSVRLNDEGLAALDALGKVVNVVRLGDLHGVDDPFYVDHYDATFWALPNMGIQDGLKVDKELVEGGEMPVSNSSLFTFKTTKRPEGILRMDRDGGIMISCDALQNWVEPDAFTDEGTVAKMTEFGFYTKANPGPGWMHASEPQPDDFASLKAVSFKHALCGHGTPLLNTAMEDFHATWARLFKV